MRIALLGVSFLAACAPPPARSDDANGPPDLIRPGPDAGLPPACAPLGNSRVEPHALGYSATLAWDPLPQGDTVEVAWREAGQDRTLLVDGTRGAHVVIGLTPATRYWFRLTRRCAGDAVSPHLLLLASTGRPAELEIQTSVPYAGSETDLVLFNCFQPMLDGGGSRSAIAVIDRQGKILWAWSSPDGRAVADVDWVPERGTLIAGVWGSFTELGLDGKVRLTPDPGVIVHHDLDFTPLGFTALYYRLESVYAEYAPRLSEGIRVFDPASGEAIWDWHLDAHLSPDDYHPEDIKQLFLGVGHDWTHANDLDYLEDRKQFVINIRNLDRALFVDYPSGKIAAGMGRGTGLCEGLWSHSHEIVWLEIAAKELKGRFLMFDNGNYRDPPYSRVIEVELDAATKACDVVWEYRETSDFYANALSAAYRLASGDTLITDGTNGRVLQVDRKGTKRWEARVPACQIYQAKPVPRGFLEPGVIGP